jgi:hypothetical protein
VGCANRQRSGDVGCALRLHCNENPIYVFPEKELRGLSPNFHIFVSVGDVYIPRIGLPILLQENMWTDPGNIYVNRSQTHECENRD